MLVRFSVCNFLSVKGRMTLSMAAGKSEKHPDHLISFRDHRLLKGGFIFGSDTSDFQKALEYSRNVIVNREDEYNF